MKVIISQFFTLLFLSSFAFAQDANKVQVDVVLKTTKSWTGDLLPAYPKGQPEVTILKIVIPPHTKLPVHKHPVMNAGILTKGELVVVTQDNKELHMKAGDSINEVVHKWHNGENRTDKPAEIIVFYAGIEGKPNTIKK